MTAPALSHDQKTYHQYTVMTAKKRKEKKKEGDKGKEKKRKKKRKKARSLYTF